MHRPFVTTVKFENEDGGVMRLEYAADAKTELERRFHYLEVKRLHDRKDRRSHLAAGANAQATSALRYAAGLSRANFQGGTKAYLPQEEICPISEQLLFSLYDAAKRGLPVPVAEVPPERRSSVALFCYRRSHLEEAALAVAATCDEEDLVEAGGPLGRTLFLKSRNVASASKNSSLNSLKALKISFAALQRAEGEDDEDEAGP
jgi:hypothetical protein